MLQEPLHAVSNSTGLYEASFTPSVAGIYTSWVQWEGQVQVDGVTVPFMRTAFLLISVAEKSVRLTGNAYGVVSNQDNCSYLSLNIGLEKQTAAKKTSYRVYGELWMSFVNAKKGDLAIGWISGLSDLVVDSKLGHMVSLKLDLSVLLPAIEVTFSLRNVRVEDLTAYIPVTTKEKISVEMDSQTVADLEKRSRGNETIESCVEQLGKKKMNSSSAGTAGSRLILVHGFCVTENPFPRTDFTSLLSLRSNDEFARLVCEFGEQFDSFGLVGHSQGGIASLHLYTYYHSGLDAAVSAEFQSYGVTIHLILTI